MKVESEVRDLKRKIGVLETKQIRSEEEMRGTYYNYNHTHADTRNMTKSQTL